MTHLRTLAFAMFVPTLVMAQSPRAPNEWPVYGGDAGATKYSPLTQIDRTNVARLEVAWR